MDIFTGLIAAWAVTATTIAVYSSCRSRAYRRESRIWQRNAAELLEMLGQLISSHVKVDGVVQRWLSDRTPNPSCSSNGSAPNPEPRSERTPKA